jgi:hypothetical protein
MADVSDADALIESFDVEPGYFDWARFGPLSRAVRDEMSADAELLGTGRTAGIDLAYLQAVGLGVLLGGKDARDHHAVQRLAQHRDILDLKADRGQHLGQTLARGVGGDVLPEPILGELHSVTFILSFRAERGISVRNAEHQIPRYARDDTAGCIRQLDTEPGVPSRTHSRFPIPFLRRTA